MTRTSAACGRGSLALVLAALAWPALGAPVALAPAQAGQFQAGSGVDATFLKVVDSWQQSTVLWNQGTQQYGSGTPISGYGWGTGLWGIADWHTAQQAPTPGMIEHSWSGRVAQVAWGDEKYNSLYGTTWGTVDLAPLFTDTDSQDNWTSSFGGYIRISEAGIYNFSVLHDDGFFFKLRGADASQLELSNDFLNPRDALGFASNLQLGVGLYAFELGAYDRLEAGVVELSWSRGDGDWSRIPTSHLVANDDVTQVPEPGTWSLVLVGLMALASMASRRRLRP